MAIRISFGGATLLKPGSYSKFRIDNSAGGNLANNDTIMIVGEAAQGAPGDVEGIQEFRATRLTSLIEKYGSGPIVDAAFACVRLSQSLAQGIGGAGRILIWKTNSSTQAEATLQNTTPADLYSVKDRAYGEIGNNYSVIIGDGTTPATQKTISIAELGGTTENLGENAATDIITIQYTGDATTATAGIAGASRTALTLTTTLAGDQTDGSVDLSIALNGLTMKQLVDQINAQTGYTATVNSTPNSARSATELDPVTVADLTAATVLRRLQNEILDLLNSSQRVEATFATTPVEGLPSNQTGLALSGGAQGASTNTDFSDGFDTSLAEDYNVLLAPISRDASDDILDADLGFTDAASTYDVQSVTSAAVAHLNLRGSIKNRKEAQGVFGFRDKQKDDAFSFISGIGSSIMQGFMQDVRAVGPTGSQQVYQPHIAAAIAAGIRLGTAVGEPLTHKFMSNLIAFGHFINPNTLLEEGDFNAALDADEAIEQGVTFLEKAQGSARIVVDNTTYGIDDNFVLNRGSVIEASFFVFRTLRETAEQVFIGRKTSNGLADSIKNTVRNKLRELNQPDVQIITSSLDAPEGFVEETFTVEVPTGNTAIVSVEFKPVQGLDFVLYDFTLGDIQQSA